MQYTSTYSSPLGTLLLASDGEALTGLWMEGQKYYARTLEEGYTEEEKPVFAQTKRWLDAYFAGENPALTLPLAPSGSVFRKVVWQLLCEIPYGEVTTYGALAAAAAARLGKSHMSAQATGGAVGQNPVSIIIPCHRVVGADGSLTGYAGGIAAKQHLLRLEGVNMAGLYHPTKGTAL